MKTFSTSGTGNQQTLSEIESDKIPIYDSLTDAEADLSNLTEGQIGATKDTGSELSAPVDTVQSGNMHAVTSNAVAESLSYFTSEVNTGKTWIDGKPIYRRFITVENVIREQYTDIMSNVGAIVSYGGEFWGTNSKYIIPCRWLGFYNENSVFKVYNYDLDTASTLKIWVEYTKATD